MNMLRKPTLLLSAILAVCALFGLAIALDDSRAAAAFAGSNLKVELEQAGTGSSVVYLPVTLTNYPRLSPFGAESNKRWYKDANVYRKGLELNIKWARLGERVSWRYLQPNEGDPIDWTKLAKFEQELKALKAAGITPVVILNDSPYWATVEPSSCAAIREDKFPAFESFMRALVMRYKKPEFNVHDWEIGNEPDVDPDLVDPNNVFGCWGDIDEKYYGGEHYGEMLKVIGPAIKQVDPDARVWFGGLLLDSPNSSNGKPERFLEGALEAGAGPFFDVLGYHWYPPYLNQVIDHDLVGRWSDLGGGTVGKARFLREIMEDYGVKKPLVLNETSLMCPPTVGDKPVAYCSPPPGSFFQMQANHGVRSFVRGLSVNVAGFSWYTLNGPGWRNTGLLDEEGKPRPSFYAIQHLIAELEYSRFVAPVSYGAGLEAYAFSRGNEWVHVVWTSENVSLPVSVPQTKFIAAFDRDGTEITPTLSGTNYKLNIGFRPVYLIRKP